jgi:phosphoglucosamine mutase
LKPKTPRKLFGTDGIRGEAGKFPLDSPTIRMIGASLARHLAERIVGRAPRIVIGRDTRESGSRIEQDLVAAAGGAGAEIQSAGIITTPGVAFLARTLPADAGVVISASHNPYRDNGIKVFDPSGRKLDDTTERRIERDVAEASSGDLDELATGCFNEQAPDAIQAAELQTRYLNYLEHDVAHDISLSNLKIVVDCANGAAYEIGPQLFTRLGARVIAINNHPDGRNINLDCGSLHIEGLQRRVVDERADLGVAFDGDADRALFVDAGGNFVGDGQLSEVAWRTNRRGRRRYCNDQHRFGSGASFAGRQARTHGRWR